MIYSLSKHSDLKSNPIHSTHRMSVLAESDRQLEIFETPDPPAIQQTAGNDTSSHSVEEIRLGVKEGFKEFKNANIDTSKTDFSRIHPKGYALDPWEYELTSDGEKSEGIVEKYTRLEREISQLKSDLKTSNEETERTDLLQQIDGLDQQLSSVKLDKIYSEHISAVRGVKGIDRTLASNLLGTVQCFGGKKGDSGQEGGTITYDITLKPDDAKYLQASALRNLDERLSLLERIVGGRDDKIRTDLLSTVGESQSHSLMSSLSVLQRKCLALDQGVVGNLNQKAGELLQKMDRLRQESPKEKLKENGTDTKITELHELSKQWETTASLLPDVIERLHTLKYLHESAGGFNLTLNQLEQKQTEVSEILQTNRDVLDQVSQTLEANMERIQQNFASVNKRIEALTSKP